MPPQFSLGEKYLWYLKKDGFVFLKHKYTFLYKKITIYSNGLLTGSALADFVWKKWPIIEM